MEEENGNYLYILFIVVGAALLAIGCFYFFTDDGIRLESLEEEKPGEQKVSKRVTGKDIVKLEYQEGNTLKIGNKDFIVGTQNKADNNVVNVNGKNIGVIESNGNFSLYKIYDKYLMVSINNGEENIYHYYIVDSTGKILKDIYDFSNGTYASFIENGEVFATRFINDENTIIYENKQVNMCSIDEISDNKVPQDIILKAKYKLIYTETDEFSLELVKDSESSLVEMQSSMCN